MKPRFELFHLISHPPSARVRRFITDFELAKDVRFRNVSFPDALEALRQLGGDEAPALWDGEKLFSGAEAIEARLRAFLDVGRS